MYLQILCIPIDCPSGWLRLPLLLPMGTIPIDISLPTLDFHQDFTSFSRFIFSSNLLAYQYIPSNTALKKDVHVRISCRLMGFSKEKTFIHSGSVHYLAVHCIRIQNRHFSFLSNSSCFKADPSLKVICLLVNEWLETEMV